MVTKRSPGVSPGHFKTFAKPRGISETGEKIFIFMRDMKVKGNFRDYVLFVGNQMFDYSGIYPIQERPESAFGERYYVVLFHKKDLHDVLGEAAASLFWCRKTRTRNPQAAYRAGWGTTSAKPLFSKREEIPK